MFCSFCNNELSRGTGMLYVKKDGTVMPFCSSKCRHNLLDLGREGRRTGWTNKGAALTHDKKAEKKESAFAKDIEAKLAEKAAAKVQAKK